MSVNDIIDYVIKTPGNTNPAVIKSMVELENYGVLEKAQQMDEETLALAKAYTDSQRLAYTEIKEVEILPPTVCPYDPDTENGGWNNRYVIPYPDSWSDNKYDLYINGEKIFQGKLFQGDIEWLPYDYTDTRFEAYYSRIYPGTIDPIPESITVSIKEIVIIDHPIEAKYLPDGFAGLPVRVDVLETGGILIEKAEYTFERSNATFTIPGVTSLFAPGLDMRVHFDGTDYDCTVIATGKTKIPYAFGNLSYASWEYEDTGEPFCCVVANYDELQGIAVVVNEEAATSTHTVEIRKHTPIDPKQLPEGGVGYSEPNVITFDGDTTGKTIVGTETEGLVKLSDKPIDLNDVTRIVVGLHPVVAESIGASTRMEFSPADWEIREMDNGQNLNITTYNMDAVISNSDGTFGGFQAEGGEGEPLETYVWISRIEYGEIDHPIDPKYLPKDGFGYTESWSITWDGNTEGRMTITPVGGITLVHVSDKVLTADDIIGSMLTTKDSETGEESSHIVPAEEVYETAPGIVSAESANITSIAQDTDYEGFHIKAGTYFLLFSQGEVGYHVCSASKETIVPIDPKYLPDTVATKADIFGAMEASY